MLKECLLYVIGCEALKIVHQDRPRKDSRQRRTAMELVAVVTGIVATYYLRGRIATRQHVKCRSRGRPHYELLRGAIPRWSLLSIVRS
ncbi:hypothetical protein CC78DRAFT_243859 [Lojkania enalia]|uniref:Uncharacterized protein n=1 Tax=Lojkania enalia TaxID=147567 RepID=A0A9P4TQ55_9PLEO|nr:hypothetical protein CC78DRAFT_243859 [Didymosphaeria enalia]